MVTSTNNENLSGMRILMLAPCLGKFGGIETFCLTLIEDLLARGASVRLLRKKVKGFAPDGSIEKTESEIRETLSIDEQNRFQSEFVERTSTSLKRAFDDCDLVHLHNPSVEGIWMAKRRNLPSAMTIYNWRRRGLHPRLLAWNWAVRSADRRWYISEFVWNSWEKTRRKGSARLPVVSRMPSGEIPANQRKGFLFLGRWIPNKGLRILIEAYHQLAPDPQTWPLNLVGDGPLRPEVEKLIMDKKIKGVILHGFVSEEERLHRTRQAKWMVTPPHTNEDLGLTPLEARSVGVPCIVSEDGGVPETGGVHALRCEPNSVESLLSCLQRSVNMKESEYERMSLLAKERLVDYVRPLDEYAEEYLKLVGKR